MERRRKIEIVIRWKQGGHERRTGRGGAAGGNSRLGTVASCWGMELGTGSGFLPFGPVVVS